MKRSTCSQPNVIGQPCRLRRPRSVARTRRASLEVIKLLPPRAALAEPSPAWESRFSGDARSILGNFRIFYLMGLVAPVAASCWRSRLCMSKMPRQGPSTLMRRTISRIPGSPVNPGVADNGNVSMGRSIFSRRGVNNGGLSPRQLRKMLLQKLKRECLSVHSRFCSDLVEGPGAYAISMASAHSASCFRI
jgi:hypothetical protein